MASIIDSIKSIQSDRFAILKMAGFSYGIYLIYTMVVHKDNYVFYNGLLYIAMTFLYLGFCTTIMSNRINQRMETLPGLNIYAFIQNSLNSFLIIIPYLVLAIIIVNIVLSLFNFEGIPQQIAVWLIRFCIFCIFLTALIRYAEKNILADGYNFTKIMGGVADVLVYTFLASIAMFVFTALFAAPTMYLIYTFFEFGMPFQYGVAFFVTIILAIMSDYWGQLYYDIESRDDYY